MCGGDGLPWGAAAAHLPPVAVARNVGEVRAQLLKHERARRARVICEGEGGHEDLGGGGRRVGVEEEEEEEEGGGGGRTMCPWSWQAMSAMCPLSRRSMSLRSFGAPYAKQRAAARAPSRDASSASTCPRTAETMCTT